jgi:hypothetical protein
MNGVDENRKTLAAHGGNVPDIPRRLKWLEASSEGRAWLRDLPARVQAWIYGR